MYSYVKLFLQEGESDLRGIWLVYAEAVRADSEVAGVAAD